MSQPSRHLNMWKRRLGRVPESVWDQVELETLVLAVNDLQEIPAGVGRLTRLRMLDLGHNALRSVPETLGDLETLSDFLYLHDNRLSSLPSSLARLKRLRYLNISENEFETLPECAVGARITYQAADLRRSRMNVGGGSFLSSHDPRLVLGIGKRSKIDWLEIKWPRPSGTLERFTDLPIDRYITIVEGQGKWM